MLNKPALLLLAPLLALGLAVPAGAASVPAVRGVPGAVGLSADPKLAAWQRLQFGLFIHWGVYSELGGVWRGEPVTRGYSEQIQMWANIPESEYREVAARFQPERFDPAGICALAKQAGMKYVVITSKHHDGFAMFDTATTGYDVVDATPYRRDPLKRLSAACREQGLGFGVYFSLVDWHQGHAFDGNNENPIPATMEPVVEAQLRELMTGYGPISEVWFDMSTPTARQSGRFAGIVRAHQPGAVVNSRVWNNTGDFRTLGDNEIPEVPLDGTWQTPASVYHETWGYRSWQKREDLPGKIRDLVVGLTSVRARGGNYLLNIGPRGDGSVVEFEADVLRGIGAWHRRHPGAVLGASATRFGGQPWGEVTVNGRDLFLHVTHWPTSGELRLPGLATRVRSVAEDGGGALRFRQDGDDLVVNLPATPKDTVLPVLRAELAGELRILPRGTVRGEVMVLADNNFERGHSYADAGGYSTTRRTTVRQTAYAASDRGGPVALTLRGTAEPATRYRVQVGDRSRVVTGAELTTASLGPFPLRRNEVTEVTITRAEPAHQGQELGAALSGVLAPADRVLAWAQPPARLESGRTTEVPVHVTNLRGRPVSGAVELRLPPGWPSTPPVRFTDLAPGQTTTVGVPVTPAANGEHRLLPALSGLARDLAVPSAVRVVSPNQAVGKAATQVSTAWGGVPERAVDGNTAGDYLRDSSASHTAEPAREAWWQVDLGRPVAVDEIEVWNRTDCCQQRLSDYWVLVSDHAITADSLAEALATPGVHAVHRPDAAARPTSVELTGVTGRHVRVQLASATDPLTLAEVVVRGR
ncbi:alpha-L-fucosidase [Crossiella equi]|uniref:alpha-L-fucosidase n=1 Tax=Crossiella equi TaxID=130796 RepID=A0ABS5AR41_9PSEU|nr:alpha-L-fucosidase [Crossiella equi]MBP2478911.1 alpha-L-fucosidase [Crossiella equi]